MHTHLEDFVRTYDNILSANTCKRLIAHFDNSSEKTKGPIWSDQGYAVNLKAKNVDEVLLSNDSSEDKLVIIGVRKVLKQYAPTFPHYPITGCDDSGYSIKRYEPKTQFYDWHVDNCAPQTAGRLLAMLFYLNDVDEGGETEFEWGLKVTPKRGRVLVFPTGFQYPHKGCAPISGPKYILNTFITYIGMGV